MPPVLAELARHNLAEGAASMRAARQAGVKIALGSDMSLATGLEIQRMVQHGLTPGQALAAATGTAAEALGLDEHLGTVTEGKLADLIVVDGDPLAEPAPAVRPRPHLAGPAARRARSPARRSKSQWARTR